MKRVIVALLAIFGLALSGCSSTSTVGNGKIDPVEEATIRLAIGTAMSAYPAAVEPAYLVSSALLVALGEQQSGALTDLIDVVIANEVSKLNLDPVTTQSFNDLVILIKAKIQELLNTEKIEASNTYIVVKDLIKIVNEAAVARR